jgi:hypothetical protein
LFFKGPTAQRTVFVAWPALLFSLLFCVFFQTSFLTAIKPKSSQNGSSQTTKNHKKLQEKVTETHPQSGPVKRLSLAGAKPLKLTTLTTLSAVFPKAQSSQSGAKMEAKMTSSGTQNHEKSKTRAPQKTLKKKPTKSWTGSPFWSKNGVRIRGGSAPEITRIEVLPAWELICRHFLFLAKFLVFRSTCKIVVLPAWELHVEEGRPKTE